MTAASWTTRPLTAIAVSLGLLGALSACEPSKPNTDMRLWTDSYAIRVSTEPLRPEAELVTVYKVVVLDKKTNQPIETGEGRVFASNKERVGVDNGLAKGKEVGTYYARLRFPSSGDWALGIQFRRSPTDSLERTEDWMQTILPAPPLGSELKKQ